MTIDELKVMIVYWAQDRRNGKNIAIEVCKAFKELQWYREQDLIRREDADNILYDEPIMGIDGTCYGMSKPSLNTIKERLTNIPKAEPPKMRDANSEEIKNTNDYLKTISQPTGVHFEAETYKENE